MRSIATSSPAHAPAEDLLNASLLTHTEREAATHPTDGAAAAAAASTAVPFPYMGTRGDSISGPVLVGEGMEWGVGSVNESTSEDGVTRFASLLGSLRSILSRRGTVTPSRPLPPPPTTTAASAAAVAAAAAAGDEGDGRMMQRACLRSRALDGVCLLGRSNRMTRTSYRFPMTTTPTTSKASAARSSCTCYAGLALPKHHTAAASHCAAGGLVNFTVSSLVTRGGVSGQSGFRACCGQHGVRRALCGNGRSLPAMMTVSCVWSFFRASILHVGLRILLLLLPQS